jgi:hypothetical protein
MDDFRKSLEDAQHLPELDDVSNPSIPDPLSSGGIDNALAAITDGTAEGEIPGVVKTHMEYHSARLQIGASERGFEHGKMQYEESDDSARLKEIMDDSFNGKSIITTKKETFLRTGGIVIWLEWMTYVEPSAKENRDYLTEKELRSPVSPDKDSDKPENATP